MRLAYASLLAAGFALAAAHAAHAADTLSAEDRRLFADGLQSRRLFDRAATEYEALLRDCPDIAERDVVLFRWGESLRQTHRMKEADEAFARLLAEFPASHYAPRALFSRAAIALAGGSDAEAAALLERVLAADPDPETREDALYYLGEALWRAGREADAVPRLESFLAEYPSSDHARYARISLALSLERRAGEAGGPDADRARALLREVADGPDPDIAAEALFLAGQCDFARGNYAASADAFAELRRRFPDSRYVAESATRSAWASERADRPADTLAQAEAALRDPDAPHRDEWLYLRGRALFQLDRPEDGLHAMEELVNTFEQSPYLVSAAYACALGYARVDRHADAIAFADLIPADDPLRPRVLRLSATSLEALGRTSEAITAYRELRRSFPDDEDAADSLFRLARLLQAAEDWPAAAEAYGDFARRFSADALAPRALFAAAACRKAAGEADAALAAWDDLARRFPADDLAAEADYLSGIERYRLGLKDDALAHLDAYLERGPKSAPHRPDALFWRGCLLLEAGRAADALESLQASAAASPSDALAGEIRFQTWYALQTLGRLDDAADALDALLDLPAVAARLQPAQVAWAVEHQFHRGRFPEARRAAKYLAASAPDDDWRQTAWAWLGRVEAACGDAAAAEAAFQKAAAVPAETRYAAEAHLRIGEYRLAAGDHVAAERSFTEAVERSQARDMADVRIRSTIGLAHAWLVAGRREDAARQLLGVCMITRDDTLIPPLIAETVPLLRSLGQSAEADVLLQDLRDLYPESPAAHTLLPPRPPATVPSPAPVSPASPPPALEAVP